MTDKLIQQIYRGRMLLDPSIVLLLNCADENARRLIAEQLEGHGIAEVVSVGTFEEAARALKRFAFSSAAIVKPVSDDQFEELLDTLANLDIPYFIASSPTEAVEKFRRTAEEVCVAVQHDANSILFPELS
jgi:hypothetical protein